MNHLRLSRYLEPSNPNSGTVDGGGSPSQATPFVVREQSSGKIGVEPGPSKLPEGAKNFKFDIGGASDILQDTEGSNMPEVKVEDKTGAVKPIDVANAMLKGEDGTKKTAAPVDGEKKVEAQPTAPTAPQKKEEPAAPKKDEPVQPRQIIPKGKNQPQTKEFDYSPFTPEEAAELKQMSTTARDFTVKLLKERKELSSQAGGQYLQHPDAYVLDPSFTALNEDRTYAVKEAQYWEQQLMLIKQGKPWKPVEKWDAKGNPVTGAERPANEQSEIMVQRFMNEAYGVAQAKNNELQQFTSTYKQRVTQDMANIQAERAKRFGWVANPEILKATFVNDAGQEVTVEQCRDHLINMFPPYMRKELGVQVAADMFVAFQVQAEEMRNGGSVQQKQVETQRETFRAEPTGGKGGAAIQTNVAGGKPVGAVKTFSIEGMPQ